MLVDSVWGTSERLPRASGLLTLISMEFNVGACAAGEKPAKPVFVYRVLVCAGDLGNSYEVMGRTETRQLLFQGQHWGFNRYADWVRHECTF